MSAGVKSIQEFAHPRCAGAVFGLDEFRLIILGNLRRTIAIKFWPSFSKTALSVQLRVRSTAASIKSHS